MTFFKKLLAREQKPRQSSSWLVNISVRWKLNLIIVILIAGFAGLFYSAYSGLQTLQYHISFLYESMLVPATTLDRADIALGDIQTQLEALRKSTQTTADKLDMMDRMKDKEDVFSSIFQNYTDSWQTSLHPEFTTALKDQGRLDLQQDEVATISQVKKDFEDYLKLREKLRGIVGSGMSLESTNQPVLDSTIAANGALRNHLRHITDLNRQFAIVSKKSAQTSYNQAIFAMVLTLAISVILGLILAFVVSQSIASRLGFVTKSAQSLQQGHMEERATTNVGGQDEIGQMAVAFDAMSEQLTQNLSNLELRVTERTLDLEQRSTELADRTTQLELANIRTQKRASQFQAIADVSRATASIRKLSELLPRVTKVVSEQFGFYHTGIFLLDEASQYAILSAASSEGGIRMLIRGHRLKVGDQGIVGYVTKVGEPRIVLDTGTDAVFAVNPDLPDTRSEMAVPLKSGGKIIGALDVQSNQSNAFSQEDSDVLQILADQISIAIENARQFEQSQKSLSEVETIYRQYLRREWGQLGQSENVMGYRHTIAGIEQLTRPYESSKIDEALASGTVQAATDPENNESTLAVPIKLRDEVIGVLNIRAPRRRSWSADEINMVKSVADRVAISAENARLFEETTNRAERERTVSEITSKIRSTNDPGEMIQIALDELKNALNVKVARIVPYSPPQSQEES
jgi:GAF domain-containing protein/HAMP domain-containing protein